MTQATEPTGTPIDDIVERIARPIVLVGLMGTGKSTIGRRLANLLQLDFVDADEEIEAAAQMSIAEIFDQFGEAYFRDGERRVIARLMQRGPVVIATGGGAFVNSETRALILRDGVAVWLDCDIDTLVERTARKTTRPLLNSGDPAEILNRLDRERRPLYSQAPIRVGTDRGPHHQTVMRIVEALRQWL